MVPTRTVPAGWVDRPPEGAGPESCLARLHPGKDSPAASRICFASEGVGMLRFDNLGLGDSDGGAESMSFLLSQGRRPWGCQFMIQSGRQVRLLVGPSFGGAAVRSRRPTGSSGFGPWGAGACAVRTRRTWSTTMTRWWMGSSWTGEAPFPDRRHGLTLRRHFIEDVRAAVDLHEQIPHAATGVAGDALPPPTTRWASRTPAILSRGAAPAQFRVTGGR